MAREILTSRAKANELTTPKQLHGIKTVICKVLYRKGLALKHFWRNSWFPYSGEENKLPPTQNPTAQQDLH
jgi:hypothetical protein